MYAPGTTELKCEYCGHTETIISSEESFEELALKEYLGEMGGQSHSEEITMIQCKNCGANQHVRKITNPSAVFTVLCP